MVRKPRRCAEWALILLPAIVINFGCLSSGLVHGNRPRRWRCVVVPRQPGSFPGDLSLLPEQEIFAVFSRFGPLEDVQLKGTYGATVGPHIYRRHTLKIPAGYRFRQLYENVMRPHSARLQPRRRANTPAKPAASCKVRQGTPTA